MILQLASWARVAIQNGFDSNCFSTLIGTNLTLVKQPRSHLQRFGHSRVAANPKSSGAGCAKAQERNLWMCGDDREVRRELAGSEEVFERRLNTNKLPR